MKWFNDIYFLSFSDLIFSIRSNFLLGFSIAAFFFSFIGRSPEQLFLQWFILLKGVPLRLKSGLLQAPETFDVGPSENNFH